MRRIPYYPFLFAIYPVLALLGNNIEEIPASVAIRPGLIALAICAGSILVLRFVLKNWDQAAILASVGWIAFFAYGLVYKSLKGLGPLAILLDRHRFLAPLWFGLFLFMIFWLLRSKAEPSRIHTFFSLVAVTAVIFPLAQIGLFWVRAQEARSGRAVSTEAHSGLRVPAGKSAPDVYYIILDAYSRDDTLLAEYGLDNTPFLEELQELGFFVARCSQSNYSQTQLSLASSLNMNYLDILDRDYSPGNTNRVGLEEWIRHSAVRKAFEELGYQTVAFETGFKGTEWHDADVYLAPTAAMVGDLQVTAGLNGFELLLIDNSAGILLTDAAVKLPEILQTNFDNPNRIHYNRILFAFDQLRKMPQSSGPKLVFAHLVIPHPPYVFSESGEFTNHSQENKAAYREQVIYLNNQLIPLLRTLIEGSATPPVIVIQGDHGGTEAAQGFRMNILNAYYLPGQAGGLYDRISPVNTFRLIFNEYFGGDYEILEDVSYFSVYKTPFDTTVIPERRDGCTVK